MDRKLRVGVIGCDLNLRAALPFLALPRDKSEIVAVADRDPEMLKKAKEAYPNEPAKYYNTADELIADENVDAVFVMVRDQYHEDFAVKALEAGKAVYLEKPMAISIEGCDHILETAYRTKSKLFVGHNMRYMQFTRKMKEIIDSGIIGPIQTVWCRHFVAYGSCYFHHWCAEQANCNGLLLQKGAHDIDVIQWLAGAAPARVVGMGRLSVYNQNPPENMLKEGEKPDRKVAFTNACWPPTDLPGLNGKMDVEDSNTIMMQLENGVLANYMHCMYTPDSERNYTFIGTKGRIENVGDYDYENGVEIHVWTQRGSRKKPDIVYHLHSKEGGHGGSDMDIVPSFVEFVTNGREVGFSPIDARNAVAAGCMAHFSMRHGSVPCDIPKLRPELIEYFKNGQKS